MRVSPVPALMCVVMLVMVVSLHPVLANPHVSDEEGSSLFPGVRSVTLTEVGVDNDRVRGVDETTLEFHTDTFNVKIHDPFSTASKRTPKLDDLRGDAQLADIATALNHDGYELTGESQHQYEASVTADVIPTVPQMTLEKNGLTRSATDLSTVTSGNMVTYYTFTNMVTNTSRVVMTVQPLTSDGTPVSDRRVLVTPIFGKDGIIGADTIGVYEPKQDAGSSSQTTRMEANELTPLLSGATTVSALAVAGGIVCGVTLPVVAVGIVIFAVTSLAIYCIAAADFSVEAVTIPSEKRIREFSLVKNTLGGSTVIPWYSHIVYSGDGSVVVKTPAPWWKQLRTKGTLVTYSLTKTTRGDEQHSAVETFDIEAPSGSEFVFPTSNTMVVKYKGTTILDAVVDTDSGCGQHQDQSRRGRQELPPYFGFIQYAHQEHVNGIKHLEARLVVPSPPTTPDQIMHAFATLWIGVESSTGLVQPVLGYDHQETGKRWAIAAWAIRPGGESDIACGPKGHSEWYYPKTGETLNLALNYDIGQWEIVITDVTSHRSTRCFSDVVGTSDVTVYGGVLEGANMFYKVDPGQEVGDKNLPGTATFSKIQCNVPLTLMGVVDPKAGQYFTNLGVGISSDSKTVTLHTANV